MIDMVIPDGNEDEFISMALKLGLEGLCFLYSGSPGMIPNSHLKTFIGRKGGGVKNAVLTVSLLPPDARAALERHDIEMVVGVEQDSRKDFMKSRNSGLNQVLCEIASKKKKIIGFDVSSLIISKGKRRALLLGRMMQNVILCRKYSVKMALCSFARTPWQLRNPKDLAAVGMMIGMDAAEARTAVLAAGERIILNFEGKSDLAEGIERM